MRDHQRPSAAVSGEVFGLDSKAGEVRLFLNSFVADVVSCPDELQLKSLSCKQMNSLSFKEGLASF